jgi:predicted RNase H-like nuclease (RuvC/YqgF family)
MRRIVAFGLGFIGVLLLGATVVSYSKYRESVANYAQATAEQERMRQRYDRAVSEIVMIQDSLNAIVLGEDAARLLPARDVEVQPPGTLHDKVLSRIATLKSAIERTKERIEELDARLKRSGVKIAGLEKMIAGLRNSVSEKEQHIALLTTQVDTLETRVAGLAAEMDVQQRELAERQRELAEKQRELATIFYVIGTKKELTRAGVVEAEGGVLGLGKTLKPSGHFDETAFTPLDTDQEIVIRIPSDKAQVLSAQPVSSYVLQPVGEDTVELRIVDPKEFRKIKQVVILTS